MVHSHPLLHPLCSSVVNTNECQFCQYHVAQQYNRMRSARPDLAGTQPMRPPPGGNKNNPGAMKMQVRTAKAAEARARVRS